MGQRSFIEHSFIACYDAGCVDCERNGCEHHAAAAPKPVAPPQEPKELKLICGCVRSADGRGWVQRCLGHNEEGER